MSKMTCCGLPMCAAADKRLRVLSTHPPELRGSSAGPIVTVGPQRCGADGTGGVMVFNPEGCESVNSQAALGARACPAPKASGKSCAGPSHSLDRTRKPGAENF